jgi:hypothetical protein
MRKEPVAPPAGVDLKSKPRHSDLEMSRSAVVSGAPQGAPSNGVGSRFVRPRLAPAGPMVAHEAELTVTTKEFTQAREELSRTVAAHHGYVQNLSTSAGPAGHALVATLRFPSEELEAALAELRALGVVDQEAEKGEDLLQPHVDLTARLVNARTTEKRLNELLSQRAGRVEEVLELENEMARVREDIENMEAQLRGMEKRAELAKVNVRIREEAAQVPAPKPPEPPSAWGRLGTALGEGFGGLREDLVNAVEFLLRYLPHLLFWTLLLFLPVRWTWIKFREEILALIARRKKGV